LIQIITKSVLFFFLSEFIFIFIYFYFFTTRLCAALAFTTTQEWGVEEHTDYAKEKLWRGLVAACTWDRIATVSVLILVLVLGGTEGPEKRGALRVLQRPLVQKFTSLGS